MTLSWEIQGILYRVLTKRTKGLLSCEEKVALEEKVAVVLLVVTVCLEEGGESVIFR